MFSRICFLTLLSFTLMLFGNVQEVPADGGVTFQDIAANDGAGITYRRTPSTTKAIFDNFKLQSLNPSTPYTPVEAFATPEKSDGAPGIAIFDFDNDGDLDIYVTNGPGTPNSLYSSQLQETGQVTFVDVAVSAGVDATAQDSTGVCYGDIDNDGDHDLYVLGRIESNRLFENQGNSIFVDITASSGVGGGTLGHTSSSMGDVNGDGLLDIFVANSFDWTSREAIFVDLFASSHHNQLFLNMGSNQFVDVSSTSGIQALTGFGSGFDGSPTISWAGAIVDYDLDGDADIFIADDQAAIPQAKYSGGFDRGFIHIFQNDGSGNFTDVTVSAGTNQAGQWMGLSFGDFNSDGSMDFFGTNMGDYAFTQLPIPYTLGDSTCRWFLGQPNSTFTDPGVGGLVADPFGWGTSAFDYDNDGDTDIVYYGHLLAALNIITAENPGAVLQNDGNANFSRDSIALAGSTNHNRRGVQGVATGDLNNDGFVDIVTVSSANYPEPDVPLTPYPTTYGSDFDADAVFVEQFSPIGPPTGPPAFRWNEYIFDQGTLAVEINSGSNGNNWVQVKTLGTIGITSDGRVNRDGIGAVVMFTPKGGNPVMKPIVGGSSYASQDSLTASFGLGSAKRGVVEILWPGGVRNRVYNVNKSAQVLFPEIPCSFDGDWVSFQEYKSCVETALDELVAAGVIAHGQQRAHFLSSAIKAYHDYRTPSAPPLSTDLIVPNLVVSGVVLADETSPDGYRVTIRNTRTNAVATDVVRFGSFVTTFPELSRPNGVRVGDLLEVVLIDPSGESVADTMPYTVTAESLWQGVINLTLKPVKVPRQSALLQNYPNPFNPETWIPYELNESAKVAVQIYDAEGSLIRTLDLGQRAAGFYRSRNRAAYWDGRNAAGEPVASGIYFYQLQVSSEARPRSIGAGYFSATRRMLIVK